MVHRRTLRRRSAAPACAAKHVEQQDVQAVHRIRSELLGQRSAKAKQIRGLVAEYGLVASQDLCQLRRALPRWVEDTENGLTERFRRLLSELRRPFSHPEHYNTQDILGPRSLHLPSNSQYE